VLADETEVFSGIRAVIEMDILKAVAHVSVILFVVSSMLAIGPLGRNLLKSNEPGRSGFRLICRN
jgi:hypothetical protein